MTVRTELLRTIYLICRFGIFASALTGLVAVFAFHSMTVFYWAISFAGGFLLIGTPIAMYFAALWWWTDN